MFNYAACKYEAVHKLHNAKNGIFLPISRYIT